MKTEKNKISKRAVLRMFIKIFKKNPDLYKAQIERMISSFSRQYDEIMKFSYSLKDGFLKKLLDNFQRYCVEQFFRDEGYRTFFLILKPIVLERLRKKIRGDIEITPKQWRKFRRAQNE